ncbi:MAG: HAD family hydrolase [Thermoanaerobaculia bacterium]
MLKAIAFDLWETLITDTPHVSRQQERIRLDRMERVLVDRGFPVTAERIEHAYRALWHRCQELYWSRDQDIACRVQIEHFLEALELDPQTFAPEALDALEAVYAGAAVELPPTTVDGAAETLRALRDHGYQIGLISNTGRTPGTALRDVLAGLGLADSIQAMVFSNEHGVCKPQRSIFESLRSALGLPFEEIAFVGDNPYADVHGAQSCGMKAILFQPATRGTAVAPPVEHGLEIVPDATIQNLRELIALIPRL